MSLDDLETDGDLRIKKARRPSKEQLQKLLDLPPMTFVPASFPLLLVPENPSRIAYTALRQIYLALVDDWWSKLIDATTQPPSSKDMTQSLNAMLAAMKKMQDVELWLRPPEQPLSLEAALKMVEGSKSQFWRESIMKRVGRRRSPGQPASKRYLALRALDIKCAYPDTSQREVTNILCPCGKDSHTKNCQEQLRQQILNLVKFLRQHGHDFRWERIGLKGA